MSRRSSPYILGDYWLEKRRDGKSPDTWQIARAAKRTVVYRSTHCKGLVDAKGVLEAYVAEQKALTLQDANDAEVIPMLMAYWYERGKHLVNADQTARSIRTFIAFLALDSVGVRAVATDLVPTLFERFRNWRMASHNFTIPWAGEITSYNSNEGVSGATVQRNVNDIRAAVGHAVANLRISKAPKIKDIEKHHLSPPRERILTIDELGKIVWYAMHNADLFRFVVLQIATAVRPQAALAFDPKTQFNKRAGLIDLQPDASPQTKKRNAVLPAIRPLRVVLNAWANDERRTVRSRKTAWRVMRRTLGLSNDVFPKTIRHTIATLLYADASVPEREIVELLGHEGKLATSTRVYAKYDPTRMHNVVRSLTAIWRAIRCSAKSFAADHLLTTIGQGGQNFVELKTPKC